MRFLGSLFFLALVIGTGFSLTQAGFKWWEASQLLDDTVAAGPPPEGGKGGREERARRAILRAFSQAGFPMSEDRVILAEEGPVLKVSVRWAQPLLTLQEEVVLAIPLSIERTYGARR